MLAVKRYFPNGDLAETINIGRFPSRTAARQAGLEGRTLEALRSAWLPVHSSGYCEAVFNGSQIYSLTDALDALAERDAHEVRLSQAVGF